MRIFTRAAVALAGCWLAAGCAAIPGEPLPADHPANPSSGDAGPVPSFSTLALNRVPAPSSPADAPHAPGHHHVAPTQPEEAAALSALRWTPATSPTTQAAPLPVDGAGQHEQGGRP